MLEKKPNKVGRPKKPKGSTLGSPTPIRFADVERVKYERLAKKEGLTLSEWVRQTLKTSIE
ncbi:MAG: hypothetical protein ABL984_06745 [Pyrinomonadaceae bacterium]